MHVSKELDMTSLAATLPGNCGRRASELAAIFVNTSISPTQYYIFVSRASGKLKEEIRANGL